MRPTYPAERKTVAIVLLALIPLGFSTKFYIGPAQRWMHNYAGGMLYTTFFFLLFRLIWIGQSSSLLALAAFCLSTIIEFTQLLRTPFLGAIRANFFGRTLIGDGFSLFDIFYYFLGAVLGIIIERTLGRHHIHTCD